MRNLSQQEGKTENWSNPRFKFKGLNYIYFFQGRLPKSESVQKAKYEDSEIVPCMPLLTQVLEAILMNVRLPETCRPSSQ